MFEWHRLPDEQKRNILDEVSNIRGYPVKVIEKDWWVTVALKAVFSTPLNIPKFEVDFFENYESTPC